MIKELYTTRTKQVSLNIVDTKLESVRKKNITKVGYRVYDNGYIGIAGGMGNVDMEKLEEEAISNLELKVPYEEKVTTECTMHRDRREIEFDEEDFIREAEALLAILRQKYPDFIFGNKINMEESYVSLTNDQEVDLSDRDASIIVMLTAKEKTSINIMDTGLLYLSRVWDTDKILEEAERVIASYRTQVALPDKKKMPVIMQINLVESKLREELSGESVGLGSSLFKDFIGEQKFNENFTYSQSVHEEAYHVPFFDAEGAINDGHLCHLIENGKIVTPYTDKKTARTYGYQHTASSVCVYDGSPALSLTDTTIASTGKTLKELLNGELGIVVVMAAGGDYTPEGNFGYPVQHAILTDGEKMLGRLPLIHISNNLYDMFGKDYRGCTSDQVVWTLRMVVMDMNVSLG
ncbi:MAG: metallopeptidase TldD-related protein [Cellulosilyticaceae bacterium]